MKTFPLVFCVFALMFLRPSQTVLVDPEDEAECLDLDVCPVPSGGLTNVALRKPAIQSSTYNYFGADKAVDGNANRWFWDGKTCSHTSDSGDKYPWLRVDLQSPHAVHYVSLVTRADPCCADRNHDIEIRVGDDDATGKDVLFTNPLCGEQRTSGKPGAIFNITCSPCLIGRYVSVQITKLCNTCSNSKNNILTLCEFQIYGEKLTG